MEFEMQSPLEQIWSLLNFAPEAVFETVGEVKAFLSETEENMRILKDNHANALAACQMMVKNIRPDSMESIMTISNISNLGLFVDSCSDMLLNCLERDCIAMRVFLDVASGHDASSN